MFRTSIEHPIDPTHFGVGSIVSVPSASSYVVIAYDYGNAVTLMNVKTFVVCDIQPVSVEDPNYLLEKEVRALINAVTTKYNICAAFTDFDFDAKGLKQ